MTKFHALDAADPHVNLWFFEGYEDAAKCPCGNDTMDVGFTLTGATELTCDSCRRVFAYDPAAQVATTATDVYVEYADLGRYLRQGA